MPVVRELKRRGRPPKIQQRVVESSEDDEESEESSEA